MKSELIAYAIDFVSFLIQKIKEKSEIKQIILFGSVSREEAQSNSDIDIFIDVIKEDKSLEKKIEKILDNFKESTKYKNYWKPLGIENEISLKIGQLEKWPSLKSSMISNGITIYGKFKPKITEGKHKTFFIWENVAPNSKRVLFNKQLLGYKQKGKFYQGLLQKYQGERMGKGCILVPLEYAAQFHQLFKKYKITVKIKKVLEY
ncbi:MAG: nucleotidyltransferase domain-containing protein [Nanoarchaeota archaeon]|nr:nucleotidyltransferase domain-containing protein [Nanoarchaeota archaeon]